MFDGGRISRRFEVDLADDAGMLAVESWQFGRTAMGETISRLNLSDRIHINCEGKPLWRDHLKLVDAHALKARFALGGAVASAVVLAHDPRIAERLPSFQALLKSSEIGAVSAWDNLMVFRFLSPNARLLKAELVRVLQALRAKPLPEVWRL